MLQTRIGGYELDEYCFMDEGMSFFDTDRKSAICLRGGGGKIHVFGPYYNEMQQFNRLSYPSPDGADSAYTHVAVIHCIHYSGNTYFTDFQEELRYIKKAGILVNRYSSEKADWPKDIEFEAYFFSHYTRKAFVQLRYMKNNGSETKTFKLILYVDLKIGGDVENDQGVWDETRKAFRCWDATNPKACYMLIGSPTTPTRRGIDLNTTVWHQVIAGSVTDKDSYGPGNAAVAIQFDITLAAGASTVLPLYIVVGDDQTDVEFEWDSLTEDDYATILADTKAAWEGWIDEGIIVSFEHNPWMTEAWIRTLISAYELTWSNGGISAGTALATQNYVWDAFFLARTLLQGGHITEVRNYLEYLRDCVAADPFDPYPSIYYTYDKKGVESAYDLVHGCWAPIILVWELYEKTRNPTDLSDNWSMVKKYLDYVKDNFLDATYKLIRGPGALDHPFIYHTGWGAGKYYAAFNIAYQRAFHLGAQIAELTGHPTEKAIYNQIANDLQTAIDIRFLINGVYKSVWHPTAFPTAEGWDLETSTKYGEVGYDHKKTFEEWRKWLTDYFPAHYDEVDYTVEAHSRTHGYAIADLLHSLILYGDYGNFMLLLNRFKAVANMPKAQMGEAVMQYEKAVGQYIFAWSTAIVGALARLFDWTKNADGNYIFNLSPAPEIGKFTATFPDGTSVAVEAEGNGSLVDIQIKPYMKPYTWDSSKKKLQVTLSQGEQFTFKIAMGFTGMRQRVKFRKLLLRKGETVEIAEKVEVGLDEYGSPVYEWHVKNVEKAFIQRLKGDEAVVEAGLLAAGDAEAMLDPFSEVEKNSRVTAAGVTYEVVSVEPMRSHGTTVYLKAGLKRVNE